MSTGSFGAECRWLAGVAIGIALLTQGCADLKELTASPEELRQQQEARTQAERRGQVEQSRATLGRSADPRARAEAARQLGTLKAAVAVPELTAALRDPDAEVRAAAADALRELGDAAREAGPAL